MTDNSDMDQDGGFGVSGKSGRTVGARDRSTNSFQNRSIGQKLSYQKRRLAESKLARSSKSAQKGGACNAIGGAAAWDQIHDDNINGEAAWKQLHGGSIDDNIGDDAFIGNNQFGGEKKTKSGSKSKTKTVKSQSRDKSKAKKKSKSLSRSKKESVDDKHLSRTKSGSKKGSKSKKSVVRKSGSKKTK